MALSLFDPASARKGAVGRWEGAKTPNPRGFQRDLKPKDQAEADGLRRQRDNAVRREACDCTVAYTVMSYHACRLTYMQQMSAFSKVAIRGTCDVLCRCYWSSGRICAISMTQTRHLLKLLNQTRKKDTDDATKPLLQAPCFLQAFHQPLHRP